MTSKTCTKCGVEKEFTEFWRDSSGRDGYNYWCKSCRNKLTHTGEYTAARAVSNDGTKICIGCKEPKLVSEFFRDTKKSGGYEHICKKCRQVRRREISNSNQSGEKICSKCGVSKNSSEFYRDNRNSDGLYHQCKVCHEINASQWRRANSKRISSYGHSRRVKSRGSGSFRFDDWLKIMLYYSPDGECLKCKKVVGIDNLTIDHVIPIHLDGPNLAWNLQPLCLHCNVSRAHGTISDFRPDVGEFARRVYLESTSIQKDAS